MKGTEPVPGTVAVVGERAAVEGYGLAGAMVLVAEEPDAVRRAVRGLPSDVALVILTPAAAAALDPALGETPGPVPDPAPVSMVDRQVVAMP